MSFNIEWTNADALTPSPFTVTKDGCHFEVKVDAHYVSDEEVETVRRYIDSLHRENAKLREQLEGIVGRSFRTADKMSCLEAENAKLRELLAKARDPRRIGGTADPESFVYAIEQLREFRWQHATNDEEAIPYINNVADAHERENAKLRELVRDYERCTMHADCAGCEYDGKLSTHCPLSPCFPDAD